MDLVQELEKRYFLIIEQVAKDFPYKQFSSEMGSIWCKEDHELSKVRSKEITDRFRKSLSENEMNFLDTEKRADFLKSLLLKELSA